MSRATIKIRFFLIEKLFFYQTLYWRFIFKKIKIKLTKSIHVNLEPMIQFGFHNYIGFHNHVFCACFNHPG